ncbi:MAG TPA: molybdenum cofactor guanylyltransferase, partial [Zunongwangia profunda]|nr:molybdenum cofactor guanylyltransferase [Zunongwangia profunda]
QHQNLPDNLKTITDKDQYRGPLNGMISAHQEFPEVAWLVVATDLPLIDKNSIRQLIDQRNPEKIATAYATHQSGLPEPLFAVWESGSFPKAIEYLKSGTNTCPRKFLINSDTELIFPSSDDILINANNKQEYELALKKLQKVES